MKKIKKVFIFIFLIILIVAGTYIGIGYNMYRQALENMSLEEKVAMIKSNEDYTQVDELPQYYIDAVIAVEDHRFYEHNGIDIISISRAVVNDVKAMELKEGGSTITQQLAKNIYFSQDKTLTRKIAELFMAHEIEKNYNKDEILSLYLNTSYFGNGYYCVKDAAMGYFDKEPKDMTLYESTLLAGIPNAPSVYAPTKNFELATQRQRQVINKMVQYKYLSDDEAENIIK